MKTYSLFLGILLTSISLSAQETSSTPHKYFGIRAGTSIAHPNFEKGSPPSDIATSWGAGFVGGVYLNVPISSKFSIQPEYLFRQMNSEMTETKTTLNLNYLSLPLFIKYQLFKNLNIQAGPQFDLLIKGETKSDNIDHDITHDTEERSIAAVIGLGYTFWKTASIEAQYIHGFNHIGMYQRDAVSEFKFESLQISAAFGF